MNTGNSPATLEKLSKTPGWGFSFVSRLTTPHCAFVKRAPAYRRDRFLEVRCYCLASLIKVMSRPNITDNSQSIMILTRFDFPVTREE